MNKLIRLIAVFFVFFGLGVSNLYSEIVNKVQIEGNERVTKETIVIFGDIKIGSNYESNDINLLIKKLYETKFFSNVSVELSNNNLKIIVEENPIINAIEFKGEKSDKYKEAILELISLREKTSFLKSYIQSDIDLISNFYRTLGFYFIKIEVDV